MSYRRRRKYRRNFIVILIVLLTLAVGFFCLFEFKARDLVHNLVDNELEIHAMNAIDKAVCDVLDGCQVTFEDLIIAEKDTNGSISTLRTDTLAINKLKSELSLRITEKIRQDATVKASVPAGAFTGIVLLSTWGPDISVTLTLGGSATSTINSEFSSSGINQTIHRLIMRVEADVSLTCPIISYETTVITEYELSETVIVGSTPEFYANVG